MHELIRSRLRQFESERNIRILLAVESGSRAWGFASRDSDWDIRFIYLPRPEVYLSIDPQPDNFERMEGELDFAGWDLRKTLGLFRKSNPPLMEWIQSPLVYLEQFGTAQQMRELAPQIFDARACLHHYFHMARGNWATYLQTEDVRVKKYFYVLRPILACQWIERTGTLPPMEFEKLLDFSPPSDEALAAIRTLLSRKMAGDELDTEVQIQAIHEFLSEQVAHFERFTKTAPFIQPEGATELLNQLFRATLRQVWELAYASA